MTDRDREKVLQAVLGALPVNLITWKRTRQQVAAEIVDAVLEALPPRATPKGELRRQAFVTGVCPVCCEDVPRVRS